MKFRYARHTNNLSELEHFYCEIIGLLKLGSFSDHDGYSGIFLGSENQGWHLEFTESGDDCTHTPDPDDLLVFYFHSQTEIDAICARARMARVQLVKPKNPYWQRNGAQVMDPDGFGVILTLER